MPDETAKRLAQLKQAFENGVIDEDTYRSAVSALGSQASIENSGSDGAAAQGGIAAGESGVAARSVTGDRRRSSKKKFRRALKRFAANPASRASASA